MFVREWGLYTCSCQRARLTSAQLWETKGARRWSEHAAGWPCCSGKEKAHQPLRSSTPREVVPEGSSESWTFYPITGRQFSSLLVVASC